MKKIYFTLLTIGLVLTSAIGQEKQPLLNISEHGIMLNSEDSKIQVGFNGRIYMDGVHYFDDVTDLSSDVSISDVRLGTTVMWDKWQVKINVGFGDEELCVKDAFLRYFQKENSYFTVGNFYEPFGIEASASSKDLRFIGHSNTTIALGIGRGIGVGYNYFTDKFYGATGLYAGSIENDHKGDQGFSTTTKLAYTPIVNDNLTWQVGASFSYRKPEANGFSEDFNDDDYNREVTFAAGPEELFLNGVVEGAQSEIKYNFQTMLLAKSFLFQGEYTRSKVARDEDYVSQLMKDQPLDYVTYVWPVAPGDYPAWYGDMKDVTTEAYYAQIGFLLGDEYSYNSATSYVNRAKPGTYEFVVRYDNTNLNDIDGTYFNGAYGPADLGAALTGAGNKSVAGGKAETFSAAVNYYVSDNIMFRLNYSLMDVDNINFPLDDKVGFLNARVQVSF
ncbi:phosphate-selective porin OprO and OprP [Lutibacter oricola]|uniref:Phosphate-selective porin OprO and OprP n=1 Tax=Lutibacter oricola TaxID=762486 RepID=A0A1H2YNR3_9FLAO|nr:porin [Lutibacter oricola]SDX06882.1 phosphate-selective porin OprO and OprP [Lutibacter oricola]